MIIDLFIALFWIGFAFIIYKILDKGFFEKPLSYFNRALDKKIKEHEERKELSAKYKKERGEMEEKKRKESVRRSEEEKVKINVKKNIEKRPTKKQNNNTISTPPIDYVPRAEQSFASKDADYTYRKIYITLLWVALPLMAVFRYKMGVRVLSSFNVVVAIVLLIMNVYITMNLLAIKQADNSLIFAASFLLFIIGLRKPLVLVLSIIFILIGEALYGFYLGYSMGQEKATRMLEHQRDFNIEDGILLMMTISIFLVVRKIVSFYYERNESSVHSYYYGRSLFFIIFRRDWITHIIIEPLLVGFFGVIMLNQYYWREETIYSTGGHRYEESLTIGYMLLVSAIASCLVSIMQQYAIRDYNQDIRDVEHLSKEATQKQAAEREAEQTTYQAHGISQK